MSPAASRCHRRRGGRGPLLLLLLLPWPSGERGNSPLDWISLLSYVSRDCFWSPSPFLIFLEIRNSDWAEILMGFSSRNYISCGERRSPTDLRGAHKATPCGQWGGGALMPCEGCGPPFALIPPPKNHIYSKIILRKILSRLDFV